MDRAAAIENSLKAFTSGIIGIFPIIGVLPSIYALLCWSRVQRHYSDWNPAARHLKWGVLLATFGLLNSVLAIFSIAYSAQNGLFN
jgi:hypothetical protein